MNLSLFVMLFVTSVSFSIKGNSGGTINMIESGGKGEDPDKAHHYIDEAEVSEVSPKSLLEFQSKLQASADHLYSCYQNENLDLACYRAAKTAILNLADKIRKSDLSNSEKAKIGLSFKGITSHNFRNMQKHAEEKCSQLYHPTSDCIYFSFKNYANAVWDFKVHSESLVNIFLSYDFLPQGAQELALVAFKEMNHQYQRLVSVSTIYWEDEPTSRYIKQMFVEGGRIHSQTVSILKSKGIVL